MATAVIRIETAERKLWKARTENSRSTVEPSRDMSTFKDDLALARCGGAMERTQQVIMQTEDLESSMLKLLEVYNRTILGTDRCF